MLKTGTLNDKERKQLFLNNVRENLRTLETRLDIHISDGLRYCSMEFENKPESLIDRLEEALSARKQADMQHLLLTGFQSLRDHIYEEP